MLIYVNFHKIKHIYIYNVYKKKTIKIKICHKKKLQGYRL